MDDDDENSDESGHHSLFGEEGEEIEEERLL
jgi:hypothetical protein